MSYDKQTKKFTAVLKTLEGRIVEYGTAYVSLKDQSLDFTSDFVPIFKMGMRLKVVHVQKDIEVRSFEGEVYLSSQHLLRLVAIEDEILPGASSVESYDTKMDGQASVKIPPAEAPKRFSFLHKQKTVLLPSSFPVSIYEVSLSQFKFTCDVVLEKDQQLILDVRHPVRLKSLPMQVDLAITFGAAQTHSYRCNILDLAGYNYMQLEEYVRKLSLDSKMFPNEDAIPSSEGKNP